VAVPQPAAPGVFEGIASGKTRLIDLGHPLNPQNPHWPGPGYSPFTYEIFATLEKDHVLSGRFTMAEHTGTHLDAPNHFAAGQIPVDKIPLQQLFVPAVVIDVRESVAKNADYQLTPADITTWEQSHGRIPVDSVVMMYTGWDTRWTDFEKYKNADKSGTLHFPGFSPEATKLLVDDRNVAGIGIDTLSVDYGMSKDFAVHHISHGKGKYHLENVANLGSMPPGGAWLIVAPIKIENGTGGPARIFALVGSTS
jgi:kynurenine formamidase